MPDNRTISLPSMEAEIQERTPYKDPSFKPEGEWKKYVFDMLGYSVFAVDGTWVRNNLSIIFGHGGHPYVHEFIPMGEIWVGTHHWNEGRDSRCGCDEGNSEVSKEYFISCAAHEIAECEQMKTGKPFHPSHEKSLEIEEELGLLEDPNKDGGETPMDETLHLTTRYLKPVKGR